MALRTWIPVAIVAIAATIGACSDDGSSTQGGGADSNTSVNGTSTGNNTGGGFNVGGGNNMGQTIQIQPPSFSLTVVDGAIVTQGLTATLNGADVTSQVSWSFQKPLIGDVVGTDFTPTGTTGGVGTISATLGQSSGTAIATVTIQKTVGIGNVTPEQKAELDTPSGGADPALAMLYPFDQTVFPLDVLAPEIMWNGGGGADVYKLTINETYYQYTEYFAAPPPSRKLIAEADWTAIGKSGSGAQSDPVSVSLNRWSGGAAYQPDVKTWRIAQGSLKGAIYYWELPDACGGNSNGRILKIKPNDPVPEQFYTPGGCWGCHTVSRDGGKMMATLDQSSPFPQVTIDLTTTPASASTITASTGLGGTFSAYNDKGDRIVVSNDNSGSASKQLRIVDANSGAILNPNAMGDGCGEPAWSPDGTKLAAVCGLNAGSGWIFDKTQGYLATADVAPDGFSVGSPVTIVPQAGAPGRPAYPSFSPGSEFISYGRPTAGSRSSGQGKLWLVRNDGTDPKELSAASIGDSSFNPSFAPLRAGGYFWVVYISKRNYGNRLVNVNRQQLWITAITDPPTAPDPSHPPFYLRGQEDCGKSENAYFALEPCKQVGDECTSGVDCCGGTCIKDPETNLYVCGTPSGCAEDGNACETSADCCNAPASSCVDGFCQGPVPQ